MTKKISIVLCGKNDNYGGYFDERLYLTLKYNIKEFKKRGIETEIVFVEWNPIPDIPLLSTKLEKKFKNIKCFVINADEHLRIRGPHTHMSFLEFFAKNVGIRRATGDYILCTNADVFYGKKALDAMAEPLDDNTFYRVERNDIRFSELEALTEKAMKKATFNHNPCHHSPYTDASGDFTMGSRKLFMKIQGYDENMRFVKIHKDTRILFSALCDDSIKYELIGEMYHIDHQGSAVGTTGQLTNYRETNGPYQWKYFLNLPYTNRPFWGMADEIVDTIDISEKTKRLVFKSRFDIEEYNFDDKAYMFVEQEDMTDYIKLTRKFYKEKMGIILNLPPRIDRKNNEHDVDQSSEGDE